MTKHDPQVSIWLAVLIRDKDFPLMEDYEVEATLKKGGFPEPIITAFLEYRKKVPSGEASVSDRPDDP